MRRLFFAGVASILFSAIGIAQAKYGVDTGECGEGIGPSAQLLKTAVRSSPASRSQMYGLIEFSRNQEEANRQQCHVVYRLFVSINRGPFREVYRLPSNTDNGEIAGIYLLGFSPGNSKAAANFLLAEGDGQVNRPVIYDLKTRKAVLAEMPQMKDKRPARDTCDDAPYESLDSVTDSGLIVVSVPAIDGCADGGLWIFNPRDATLKQVRKRSGKRSFQ